MEQHLISTELGTATAHDEGALVLRWRPTGSDDVLFVSRNARLGEGVEVHGGIPICAPWFGMGRPGVQVPRPHGLVRWVPWRLVSSQTQAGVTSLVWRLDGEHIAHLPGATNYPSDISFSYTARFGQELDIEFTVSSASSFILDEALHCYFQVSYPGAIVRGLDGFAMHDFVSGTDSVVAGDLAPQGHIDAIIEGCSPIEIIDGERTIGLWPRGASSTVVWNPGASCAAELADFGDDEWHQMLCVEVGNVATSPVTVPAGGHHTLGLRICVD